ncbi:twin-arginine translocase TatA/TatE family subunit [Paracoccus sp. SCSIO 75233]|uniref:twin-arginine translocase TatA/TatE family subunit n=1 Tax=Paracoccus sp. SCSIO 75233 TaxID=3017782 RepID=UPI0022F142CE|nr:twin-arginine translocase TatA/TatE family subunit [Paracoccus sp. SCSIO 75233]WBU53312.1 twin-arginine translocase TatA/TatE family subunit [Paracoccus sp. SCSIO 75233]
MLNNIGLPGLLLIAVVVLVLFGRGKVSSLMGEVGKGISSFKKGVKEGSEEAESAGRELTDEMKLEEAKRDEKLRDVTPDDQTRA